MSPTYDLMIQAAVKRWLPGYDWRLYKAQLWQESSFIPSATSPVGAAGLAQFMPETWRQWAPLAGYSDASRYDPRASIHTGACYMAWLIDEWSWPRPAADRHCLAMASYNAGIGRLLQAQRLSDEKFLYAGIIRQLPQVTKQNAAETIAYVQKILGFYAQLITGEGDGTH